MPAAFAALSHLVLVAYLRGRDLTVGTVERAAARRDQCGQATAEYALVLLGCAAVALLVGAWAAKSGKVGDLLDKVMDSVLGKVK